MGGSATDFAKVFAEKVKAKAGAGAGCCSKQGGTAKNAWLRHVMTYKADHPGVSYRQAMKDAKATYKKA